jgi:drug/metabolite transporter (DMT)-like permease
MKLDSVINPVPVAALWMLGTVFSLSLIAIGARELAQHMNLFEMIFFRSVFGLLILTPLVLYQNKCIPLTKQFKTHLIRNVTHYLGQAAWFYGIAFIALAKVFAIEFTTPIWTLLMATFLLGEKMTGWRILAILLGIAGVLIVLRPGLIPIHLASVVVLGGSFCFALSHIYTRKLAQLESPTIILFYMNAIQVPLALLPALNGWVMPVGISWFWILALGTMSISAHYCLSRALSIADASIIIPIDFLRLPLIILVGYLFYQEALDWFVLLGAGIIFIGNSLSLRKEYHRHNANK